jgi:hypothetical protein
MNREINILKNQNYINIAVKSGLHLGNIFHYLVHNCLLFQLLSKIIIHKLLLVLSCGCQSWLKSIWT